MRKLGSFNTSRILSSYHDFLEKMIKLRLGQFIQLDERAQKTFS